MKSNAEVIGKLWELVEEYEVSKSDTYKLNVQGMIESLFWVLNDSVEPDLLDKIEGII